MRSTGVCVRIGDQHKYYVIVSNATKKLLQFKHKALTILPYEPVPVKDKTSVGKEEAIASNIETIVNKISCIINHYKPEYVIIEAVAFAAAGRTADLSGLNHCIRYAVRQLGVPIYAVTNNTNKMLFTGNGQATKEMMVESWKACEHDANELVKIGKSAEDLADAYSLSHFPEDRLNFT